MQRVAIVSGHSRGLGAALAVALAGQGVPVLGLARQAGAAAGVRAVQLDLADTAALAAWLATPALAEFIAGADDVLLVNNAGTLQPMAPLGQQGAAAIGAAVSLNVAAPLMLADALVRQRAGAPCRIVHISSGAARTAYPGWSVYGAGKAALDHHARAVALEAPAGVRIASVAPGVIDTDMQAEIRAADAGAFPLKPRFEALKRDGGLRTPADAAAQLLAYAGSAAFGNPPVCDLRDLPPA